MRPAVAFAALGWAGCATCAGFAAARHDALVALGHERWSWPLLVAAAHLVAGSPLVLAAMFGLSPWTALSAAAEAGSGGSALAAASSLGGPRGRGPAAAALIPFALLALVWVPAVLRPVAAVPAHVGSGPGRSLVLVTLDTFRADHVGVLGGDRGLTPRLDALARAGRLYRQAVTTAPLTAPAHASMFTGAETTGHGLDGNGGRLGPAVVPVAERLRAAGYRTGAFLSSPVLDRRTGLERGFHHYDDRWGPWPRLSGLLGPRWEEDPRPRRDGEDTARRALAWLNAPGPSFAWVHLYDAHAPYYPPEPWRPSAAELEAARSLDEQVEPTTHLGPLEGLSRARPHTRMAWYAASVRYVDHVVGRIADALPADAGLVVVADHGESLTEHGYYFNHGARLWEPSLHVPLITRGVGPAGVEDGLVSVAAVHQLLLEAAGLETPRDPVVGQVRAYTPGQQVRADLLAPETRGHGEALRLPFAKLVAHGGDPPVYYDLRVDPGERDPLVVPVELREEAAAMEARLLAPRPGGEPEIAERLESLGYAR